MPLGVLLACAVAVGALIGCVGVGGVLLAPALVYLGGLDAHLAVATSLWAFVFTGVAGTLAYGRRRSIDRPLAAWTGLGAMPAALVGARVNLALPESALLAVLSVVMVVAGAQTLRQSGEPAADPALRGVVLVVAGALVGFGSALTGTGGPVLLVPILLLLGAPVLTAVGVAQVVQLPVALAASAGFALFGQVDFALGTVLGLAAVAGVVVGTALAHVARASVLRRVVAVALIGAGLFIGTRAALAAPQLARAEPPLGLPIAAPLVAALGQGRTGQ